ncbi:MAG: HAMP domain-containing protein, partial [Deltaproteobacteria bacterium]|nr:HAMP domain-containing protein [Deltaproteobacteria bacterium]
MIGKLGRPATILVKAIVAINVLANLFAWLLTSVYFGILLPPMVVGNATEGIWDRMVFVLVAFGFVVSIIAPINARRVFPLIREARRRLEPVRSKDRDESETDALHRLAGKLLRLPVKLAVTTLLGWLIGAIALLKVPHTFPWIFPWTHELSHRMAAWMVFVAAPITVCWVFFSQEHWLRKKMPEFFPAEALRSVPPTFRINVLPKMLVVSLIITTIPVIMVSHVTLHQIQEIQAGRQSIAVFLDHMPVIIWFLSAVFVVVAAGLSIFMSKSFSEPLKKFESAMDTIREGHLDVTVPVVSNDEIGHTAEGFNR